MATVTTYPPDAPSWLPQAVELYESGHTIQEIRKLVGCTSVHYWFRRVKVPLRPPGRRSNLPRSLSQEKQQQVNTIIELFRSGKNRMEIAEALDISPSTVDRWLVRTGERNVRQVKRKSRPMAFPEWVSEGSKRYKEGETLQQLSARYGVSEATIRKWLHRSGIKIRSAGRKRVPQKELEQVRALRKQKKTTEEIAEILGVSISTVRDRLMLLGEPTGRVTRTNRRRKVTVSSAEHA